MAGWQSVWSRLPACIRALSLVPGRCRGRSGVVTTVVSTAPGRCRLGQSGPAWNALAGYGHQRDRRTRRQCGGGYRTCWLRWPGDAALAGTISLDGKPLTCWNPRTLVRRLAFLPQSPVTPKGISLRRLVAHGRYPHQGLFARQSARDCEIIRWAMEATGIAHLHDRDVGMLSGDERQRA